MIPVTVTRTYAVQCESNTPPTPQVAAGGGGSARSITVSSIQPQLPKTGPEDEEILLETGPQEATAETVISACEEDTYILTRLRKLSVLDMAIVKVIPSKYGIKL